MNDVDEKTEIVNSQVIKGILWRKKTERQEELIMNKKHCYVAVILFSLLVAGIQPVNALHKIPSDTTIGTWDNNPESPTYRTFTLTTDVSQGLEIMESNLILDGGTHTVTGPGSGWGVFLDAKTEVTIRKLTVQNFSLGIYMQENCSEITLEDNTVLNNNTAGIKLWKCNYIYITDNDVSNNSWGIHLWISSNNELTDNDVSDNAGGIWLDATSNSNTLEGNIVSDHHTSYGIYIRNSSDNIVKNNTNSRNNGGILLRNFEGGTSTGNRIYNNNFIDNVPQAAIIGGSTGNVFNLALQDGGGNYWSDWGPSDTEDLNNDGFWDDPYVIIPPDVVQDNLPWTVENGWSAPSNQPPTAVALVNGQESVTVEQDSFDPPGANVTLDGSGSSDDGQIQPLTYAWAWDSSSASGVNTTAILPLGTTTVTLTVHDGQLSDTDTVVITVKSVQDIVQDIIDYIVEDMDFPKKAQKEMGKAVTELNKAINEFNNDNIDRALDKIARAVKQLMTAQQKKGADTQDVIDELVALAEGIAYEAIEDAIERVDPSNPHVVEALEHYDKALQKKEDGKYNEAIKEFKSAYTEAMEALG